MPEPKGNDVRTVAARISPDFHAQLTMVAQVDEIPLADLMEKALQLYVDTRREAPDFKAKVAAKLEEAEAQMARTRAMLLGAVSPDSPDTGAGDAKRTRAKGEAPA